MLRCKKKKQPNFLKVITCLKQLQHSLAHLYLSWWGDNRINSLLQPKQHSSTTLGSHFSLACLQRSHQLSLHCVLFWRKITFICRETFAPSRLMALPMRGDHLLSHHDNASIVVLLIRLPTQFLIRAINSRARLTFTFSFDFVFFCSKLPAIWWWRNFRRRFVTSLELRQRVMAQVAVRRNRVRPRQPRERHRQRRRRRRTQRTMAGIRSILRWPMPPRRRVLLGEELVSLFLCSVCLSF